MHGARYRFVALMLAAAIASACGGGGGGGSPFPSPGGHTVVPAGAQKSTNWSGYALSTGPAGFASVSGKWTVPSIARSTSDTAASTWTGIGGGCANADCSAIDPTLIQ